MLERKKQAVHAADTYKYLPSPLNFVPFSKAIFGSVSLFYIPCIIRLGTTLFLLIADGNVHWYRKMGELFPLLEGGPTCLRLTPELDRDRLPRGFGIVGFTAFGIFAGGDLNVRES